MDEVISILIIASGIYVLYAAIRLKNDGQINKSLMISPSQPADRTNCKNIQGFQKFMFPRTLALSLVTILLGIWELAGNCRLLQFFWESGNWPESIPACLRLFLILRCFRSWRY